MAVYNMFLVKGVHSYLLLNQPVYVDRK